MVFYRWKVCKVVLVWQNNILFSFHRSRHGVTSNFEINSWTAAALWKIKSAVKPTDKAKWSLTVVVLAFFPRMRRFRGKIRRFAIQRESVKQHRTTPLSSIMQGKARQHPDDKWESCEYGDDNGPCFQWSCEVFSSSIHRPCFRCTCWWLYFEVTRNILPQRPSKLNTSSHHYQ